MKPLNESLVTKSLFVLSTAGALLIAPGKHTQVQLAGASPSCAGGVCCPSVGPVCSVDRHEYADFFFWNGECS